jgi:hypothetical protein
MNDAGGVVNAADTRPESRADGRLGRAGNAAKAARAGLWPPEVRTARHDVFSSHRTLKGLRALGPPVDSVVFDIRSRRGFGFWVMARGLGNPIAHGRTLSEATAALIRMLAPDVEEIHDQQGNRLA